jgi:site-specific recombinase XerC
MQKSSSKAIVTSCAVGSTDLALEAELAEAVRKVIGAAESENTRAAYATQTKKFEAWCSSHGTSSLPTTPAVVAVYLVDLAETGANPDKPAKGAKVSTIGLALAAISAAHRAAGFELDTKAREIRKTMQSIRKMYAAPQTQAEALKPTMVRDILSGLNDSDTALDRRDAAIVALLFAAALRRSELAGLDYAEAGSGDGYLALTSEAVEVTLLRSKARAEPVTVKIPRAENPGLVGAIERWISVAGITAGEPLFRSIKKGGGVRHIRGRITGDGVNLVLKARIARYLLDCGYTREAAAKEAKRYSGHSGRVGMYTAASEAGIAIEAVAALARHKSLNVAQKYARKADQLKRAPSKNPALQI